MVYNLKNAEKSYINQFEIQDNCLRNEDIFLWKIL